MPITTFLTLVATLLLLSAPCVAVAGFKEGLSAYYFGNYATALKEFRPLAEGGQPEAQFYLGVMYYSGKAVPQDYAEAVRWYRAAAEGGYPRAMSNLGWMYSRGKGVRQDYTQALRWYQSAAEKGLAEAQYNLGVMYKEGYGVPKDYTRAHMWFNLAAVNGHEHAYNARLALSKSMTPRQIDDAQNLAKDWKPTGKEACHASSSSIC